MNWKQNLICFICLAPYHAYGDNEPVIGDLLTKKSQWSIGGSLVYANTDSTRTVAEDFTLVQTGPTTFVRVPTRVGEQRTNMDTLIYSVSMSHGLSSDTDIFGRLSGLSSFTRTESPTTGHGSFNDSRFSGAWFGVNHRFLGEKGRPSLFGFAEVALAENAAANGTDIVSGKSWVIGITSYHIIDPVLLSASVAFQLNQARNSEGVNRDPGELLTLNTSVSFIPNRDITLSAGVNWSMATGEKINGEAQSIRSTSTNLNFGMGFAWTKDLLLFANISTNISGSQGAVFGISVQHEFGER